MPKGLPERPSILGVRPGRVAVTELTWLKAEPPEELERFMAAEYPAMQDVEANLAAVRRSGYAPFGHFTLADSAWWEPYYDPIEKKLPELQAKYRDQPEALAVRTYRRLPSQTCAREI